MVVLPAVQMYLLLQDELQFALPVGLKFPFEKEISYIFFSFPPNVRLLKGLETGAKCNCYFHLITYLLQLFWP